MTPKSAYVSTNRDMETNEIRAKQVVLHSFDFEVGVVERGGGRHLGSSIRLAENWNPQKIGMQP